MSGVLDPWQQSNGHKSTPDDALNSHERLVMYTCLGDLDTNAGTHARLDCVIVVSGRTVVMATGGGHHEFGGKQ